MLLFPNLTSRRKGMGRSRRPRPHFKRIVMNPPQSFVVAAQAQLDAAPQPMGMSGPIAIGQGGQAVMMPNTNNGNGNGDTSTAPGSASSSIPADTMAAAGLSSLEVMGTTVLVATPTSPFATTPSITTDSAVTSTPVASTTTSAASSPAEMSTSPSPSATSTTTDHGSSTTSTPLSTSSSRSSSLVASALATSPSSSSSTTSAPSSTSSPDAVAPRKFTHSALFIFLIVLALLILLSLLLTSFSFLLRRSHSLFPCFSRRSKEIDDDGLSDIVQSFHTPSNRQSMDEEKALQRRSSLFAREDAGRGSPFLHSQSFGGAEEDGMGGEKEALGAGIASTGYPAETLRRQESFRSYRELEDELDTGRMYGGGAGALGQLEVRNAVRGDIDGASEAGGFGGGGNTSPRYLGVDGAGLAVPWRPAQVPPTQPGIHGIGLLAPPLPQSERPPLSTPSSYHGPAFPSPAPSIFPTEREADYNNNDHDPDDFGPPSRAGTWASNLRTTLFAAINSARQPMPMPSSSDHFTRSVPPLRRASTVRRLRVVEEQDDEYSLPESDARAIAASSFLLERDMSASTAGGGGGGGVGWPMPPKRAALRSGGAGERYKRYARSSASGDSASESGGWTTAEERMPSRLAGGERARGQKGLAAV